MGKPDRVLVVDDEPGLREMLGMLLSREGYEVATVASAEEALTRLEAAGADVILSDVNMPGMDGYELIRTLRTRGFDTPVILVTAYASVARAVEAMREGAFDYVAKPFHNDEIRLIVRRALAMRALESDNARMRAELGARAGFGQIIGTSPAMQQVYALVRKVTGTRVNCLVGGESGTGKELVARALHYGSDRARGPFVAVNCGAIPESLVESELFGHKKGSFTGAIKDRVGHFEAADGGTLFLDEVGELPAAAQVKLLRVLAERKIVPVGGSSERTVDVRIVAATNRDLAAEVSAGRFREDLYYRLNVVQIDLPPLRARTGDLPALVQHFVDRFATEYGKPIRGASPEVLAVLAKYAFPGNVRELQNLVERAVALESADELTLAALPDRLQKLQSALVEEAPTEPGAEGGAPPSATPPPEAAFVVADAGFDLEAELAAVERRILERALQATDGNRTQAARKLGITFRSLRYRLAKFGMDPEG